MVYALCEVSEVDSVSERSVSEDTNPFAARGFHPSAIIIGVPYIGKGTWIGAFTLIDGSGGLHIGEGCDIAAGVHIYTHSSARRCITARAHPEVDRSPVHIGDYVFIGAQSVVLMGVSIGDRATIGAGSVVTRDVAPGSTVAGNPARLLNGQ